MGDDELEQDFDASWREWIALNLARGCAKEGMFEILRAHGFPPEPIRRALGLEEANPDPRRRRFIPHAQDHSTDALPLYVVDDFLDERECVHLIDLARRHLRRSTTTFEQGPYRDYRTSKTCDLSLLGDPLVEEVDRRICRMLGVPVSHSEGLQAQWYDVGEQFKAHTDAFERGRAEFDEHVGERGQRTWTFMVYLNTTEAGGATDFLRAGRLLEPRRGRAVVWHNLTPSGEPNPDSLHWGRPVEAGFKVILTKWFRSGGEAPRDVRDPNERIAPLSARGFQSLAAPPLLHERVLAFYRAHADAADEEVVEGFIAGPAPAPSVLVPLPEELRQEIHRELQGLAEAWVGRYLEPTYVYGIRRYHRGTVLEPHRDRAATHVVSAILNVDQQVDRDWPLEIEDHFYRKHQVILSPGELLLYEGGRLLHGRPTPLEGDRYSNVFVHYRLQEPDRLSRTAPDAAPSSAPAPSSA